MIEAEIPRNRYVGNSSTTVFPYEWKIFAAAHLEVYKADASDGGNQELLVLDTDYSVSGVGNDAGGTITYPLAGDPLPSNKALVLCRRAPLEQLTAFLTQGPYSHEAHENAHDNAMMVIQQHQEQFVRSIMAPVASTMTGAEYAATLFDAVDDAEAAAAAAEAAQAAAEAAQAAAEAAQTAAETAETNAETAQAAAETAQTAAETARDAAITAQIAAEDTVQRLYKNPEAEAMLKGHVVIKTATTADSIAYADYSTLAGACSIGILLDNAPTDVWAAVRLVGHVPINTISASCFIEEELPAQGTPIWLHAAGKMTVTAPAQGSGKMSVMLGVWDNGSLNQAYSFFGKT